MLLFWTYRGNNCDNAGIPLHKGSAARYVPWPFMDHAAVCRFSTAEESNKRYHYLLSQGVMGLSVAFDLPTQIGYDSDHPLSEGEVGKVGVAIDSLEDMEILFKGIDLKRCPHP